MHGAALPRRPQDFVGRDCLLDEDIPRALSALGGRPVVLRSILGSGATATAVEYLHLAINVAEHQERWLGEADPDTLRTASFIARILLSLGYCVKSAELGEKIWQIQIEVLGEEHRETLVTLHHLALALAESGVAAQRALEYFETAMTLRRKTLGNDHFETGSSVQAYIAQAHRLHDGPPSV